jgi:hypothetical protein
MHIRRRPRLLTDTLGRRLINELLMFGHLHSVIAGDRQVAVLLDRRLFGDVLAGAVLRKVVLL